MLPTSVHNNCPVHFVHFMNQSYNIIYDVKEIIHPVLKNHDEIRQLGAQLRNDIYTYTSDMC